MKKLDLGQAVSILANIGVIAGIVFLAIELQQNNEQMRAQNRANIFETQASIERVLFTNAGGIQDIQIRALEGEQLTRAEQGRLGTFRAHVLRTFEYLYNENPQTNVGFMVIGFTYTPGMREFWEQSRAGRIERSPDFVRFIESEVLPKLGQP